MKDLRLLLKSLLARRMVVYVLLFSSTVTLFSISLQLYVDYRSGIAAIEQDVEQITHSSLRALEENMWLLNISSINLMLEGMLQNRYIAYLEISDENGRLMTSKGNKPQTNYRHHSYSLQHKDINGTTYLGTLKIITTLEPLYDELIDRIIVIAITQSVKTFFVSIFIIFIVWFLISRHLSIIQRYTSNLRLDHPLQDLQLDRTENHWTKNDELSHLVQAINMMRREIFDSYSHIEYLSEHDPLTGLPNRRFLEKHIKQQLSNARQNQEYVSLLFLGLDHFKLLNDSLGHSIGDQILVKIAERLSKIIGKEHLLARIGGDEFIVILNHLSTHEDDAAQQAKTIAQEIQSVISQDMLIQGRKYKVSVSIGISLFCGQKCNCEILLKQADNALHEAKSRGRNQIELFHPEMQEKTDTRLQIEQQLHKAIQRQEFIIHYQPKYDKNNNIGSAEALIRWQPSADKMIPPGLFIPVAEQSGLIVDIGNMIITMVFRMVADNMNLIKRSGLQNISINVSSRQFIDPGFSEYLIREVKKYKLDPCFFILEITEEAMVGNIEKTIETMHYLKNKGFRLSIDDFGTGYSSFSYLKDFPLDELKVDKSFVDHIVEKKNDHAIVLSIIEIAKNLELDVVAEGVETEQQFKLLAENGCHLFQGFYFSRPRSEQDFLNMLADNIS